jgi:hypothetical protein
MNDIIITALVCAIVIFALCRFAYRRGYDHAWADSVDQKLNADTCRLCGGSMSVSNHGDVCPGHFVHHTLGDRHG